MEALSSNAPIPAPKFEPDIENIKRRLLQKGVNPSPKILRALRKKEIQKHNRRIKRLAERHPDHSPPLSESQKQLIAEETQFLTLRSEYKEFSKAIEAKPRGGLMVGRPWERLERVNLKELAGLRTGYDGENLEKENLRELRKLFEARKLEELQWVLDDDVELKDEWLDSENGHSDAGKRRRGDGEVIRFLVDRLSSREISMRDWKFSRMMIRSGLQFNEGQLLKILDALGDRGCWKQALSVVEWVYNRKSHTHFKSRFVYTKLLAVLGMARKPQEALQIFNLMRGDGQIYPDMAAYHSIAVTLGQAGLLKQLLKVIECMRQQPSKKVRNKCRKSWDPAVEPDLVVYNAILNACVPTLEWKGVYWVFTQLRKSGLKPNGATYGLSMEVKHKYRIAPPSVLSGKRNVPLLFLEGKQMDSSKAEKSDVKIITKSQVDSELSKMKVMTAEEAAIAAARAVAEAEAAIAEAERAAREAEKAEAEAESAQVFAEAAMKALECRTFPSRSPIQKVLLQDNKTLQ